MNVPAGSIVYIRSTFMLLWCTSSVALELNGSVPFRGVRPRIQISMAETRRSDDYITLTRTQGPTISRPPSSPSGGRQFGDVHLLASRLQHFSFVRRLRSIEGTVPLWFTALKGVGARRGRGGTTTIGDSTDIKTKILTFGRHYLMPCHPNRPSNLQERILCECG